jgi:chromosome segregation ATPase
MAHKSISLPTKSADLAAAETALKDLLERLADLNGQLSTSNSRLGAAKGSALEADRAANEILKIERNLRQCQSRVAEVRQEIGRLWPDYVAAVRKAVAKHRHDAATRLLESLKLYDEAVGDLKTTEKILAAVGANPKRSALVPFFPAAMNAAKKLVAQCEEDENSEQQVA